MKSLSSGPVLTTRLKLRHLQVFLNVCRLGTLRKASEASSMAQPAATKLIRELEEMVGAPLFVRHRRGMTLTTYGEVVRRHAGVLFADVASMRNEVEALAQGVTGVLRLGVIPSLNTRLLAESISHALASWPKIRITIKEGATTELLAALVNNELDLTFGRILDVTQARRLGVIPVYTETFSIVCSSHHPLARRRFVPWSELVEADWALPAEGTPLRQLVDSIFIHNGVLRPRAAVECSGYEQTRHVTAHSSLVGVLPRALALQGKAERELAMLRARLEGDFVPISLLFRKEVDQPPLVSGFAKLVCELALSRHLAVRESPRRVSTS